MLKFNAKCAYKIVEFCKQKSGKVTVAQLVALLGSERNARYGLSQIRAAKLAFEPLRVGRKVDSYTMLSTDFSVVTDALARSGAKASRGTPKAKIAKAPKAKIAKAPKVKAPVKAKVSKAVPKVAPTQVSDEAKAAAKAKNLETMMAVTAKDRLVTKRVLTKVQEEVLEEFARMELADKVDPREYMPAFLLKESYKE